MVVLLWGFVLFIVALFVHILIWRLHKPNKALNTLPRVFLVVVVTGLAALYSGDSFIRSAGIPVLPNPPAYCHVLVFYLSMSFAYIVSYTLLEWDSPTLTIVMIIAKAAQKGVEEAELFKVADKLTFVESRIQTLVNDKIIMQKDGRYVVAPEAINSFIFRFILFYGNLAHIDVRAG
jgi:hypothetical protein